MKKIFSPNRPPTYCAEILVSAYSQPGRMSDRWHSGHSILNSGRRSLSAWWRSSCVRTSASKRLPQFRHRYRRISGMGKPCESCSLYVHITFDCICHRPARHVGLRATVRRFRRVMVRVELPSNTSASYRSGPVGTPCLESHGIPACVRLGFLTRSSPPSSP